jgi:alpha-L-rhamnosidase
VLFYSDVGWRRGREIMATAEMRPTHLRCEHRMNPLGTGESSPRLSWTLESSKRNQAQSAYQVLAADTQEDLDTDRGTLWDTGKVASDRSINVVYEGEGLGSRVRCYWKVRVWNGEDDPSPYSEPAYWETGLLHGSDWTGSWIGLGEAADDEGHDPPSGEELDDPLLRGLTPSPYLRKSFELEGAVRRARLYATARGVYEMYLNGRRVGDHVLAPGWTDYDKRIQYQTYDVTGMLTTGENVIAGILGEGWYAGFFGFDPKRRGAHYGPRPQLLAQLEVEYESGATHVVASDGSWRSSTGPILFSDLLMGESYDARREIPGWNAPGFDDAGWRPVSIGELGGARLVAQPDEGVKITEKVGAKTITEPKSGVYVFDMGQNMVGWVRLHVRGETGTTVRMRFAEALNPDGTIYTTNLRFARATDSYVLKGENEEIYEPHFTFHGFRYVEVAGYPGEPSPDAVVGCIVHSDTPPAGSFECSNPMVNKLQENIVWGQRGNFLSIPTDCPQRDERLGWTGDAQIFVRTASFNKDVAAFFGKWMVDLEDAQSPEGAFPDVAPLLPMSLNLSRGAPAWGDAGIIVPWTVYRTYGDTRIVERHYGAMARWMNYLHEANPDLLRKRKLGNNYGDWLSPFGDATPRDLLATSYWAYDARLMAEMAQAIGRSEDAKGYEELFEDIKEAFNRTYVGSGGRIKGDTQTCYVLALHMDLLPDALRAPAAEHLVRTIEERGWHLATGFVGVGYLCPVLTEAGYPDVAYRLLENETYPSWGYTIKNGATTIWERWDGWTEENGFQSPNMNSFNHYSLGSVGEWLYRYVAGIDLGEPGYRHIIIRPRPGGGMASARGEYDSIHGRIVSDWEVAGNRIRMNVTIPANTTATVYVPLVNEAEITEGSRPVEQAEGVEFLRMDQSEAVFAVGSGNYEFVADYH